MVTGRPAISDVRKFAKKLPRPPRPAHITSWPGLRASAGDNRGDRGGPGPRNNKEARSDSRARRQWCALAPFSWLPWTFSTIGSWILLATSPLISWTNYFNEKGGHSLKYGNGTGRVFCTMGRSGTRTQNFLSITFPDKHVNNTRQTKTNKLTCFSDGLEYNEL